MNSGLALMTQGVTCVSEAKELCIHLNYGNNMAVEKGLITMIIVRSFC